jgi:hypothetical protein
MTAQNPTTAQPTDEETAGTTQTPVPTGTPEHPGDGERQGEERDDELPEWARRKLTSANAEAANYRVRLREAEGRLDGAKTAQEYEQAVTEIKARNAELEQQLSRERVARKYHLPDDLAARLRGATAQELEADAKSLQKYTVTPEPVVLSGGLNPAGTDTDESDPGALARKYGGRRR